MNIETYFKVMPKHTNWQPHNNGGNVIFGGEAFSQMDLLAATLCKKALFKSPTADYAVTFKFGGTFHRPAGCGDIIRFEAKTQSFSGEGCYSDEIAWGRLIGRTIEIKVKGYLQTAEGEKLFAEGFFAFVTKMGEKYTDHKL